MLQPSLTGIAHLGENALPVMPGVCHRTASAPVKAP